MEHFTTPPKSALVLLDHKLTHFPNVAGKIRRQYAKMIGSAGEALTDSLLLRHGIKAWSSGESDHTDRVIEVRGKHLKLQIKTTTCMLSNAYRFSMQHGYHRSPSGRRSYDPDSFDIAVLVILPENVVKFMPNCAHSFTVYSGEIARLRADPMRSLERALLTIFATNPRVVIKS